MTNELTNAKDNSHLVQPEVYQLDCVITQFHQANDVRMGKFVDEAIATAKDDRIITKRAISADIESTAKVQNQNDTVIAACEQELQRNDLSEERRDKILRRMSESAESTSRESAASRAFQREQLDHLRKLPWKLIGISVLIVLSGVGGVALIKSVA